VDRRAIKLAMYYDRLKDEAMQQAAACRRGRTATSFHQATYFAGLADGYASAAREIRAAFSKEVQVVQVAKVKEDTGGQSIQPS